MGIINFGRSSDVSTAEKNPDGKLATSSSSEVNESDISQNGDIIRDVSGDVIDDGLRRGLKGRHFVLISLGSVIGPGCFWGIGYAIMLSGPLGALLGFAIVGT
jgi:amino acid transporter